MSENVTKMSKTIMKKRKSEGRLPPSPEITETK